VHKTTRQITRQPPHTPPRKKKKHPKTPKNANFPAVFKRSGDGENRTRENKPASSFKFFEDIPMTRRKKTANFTPQSRRKFMKKFSKN